MQKLLSDVISIPDEKKVLIEKRLSEFSSFKNKPGEEWFSELCFCILTANSRATTGIKIQQELGHSGFMESPQEEIKDKIIKNKHRFHNNKSKYIVEARKFSNIKEIIENIIKDNGLLKAREWLAENIKGLGYKEASHFLRNTGHESLAILDRHILNLMHEHGLIVRPKTLTKSSYLEIEQKFNSLAKSLNMSPSKLDLHMWYLKTGEVLK